MECVSSYSFVSIESDAMGKRQTLWYWFYMNRYINYIFIANQQWTLETVHLHHFIFVVELDVSNTIGVFMKVWTGLY